jgi:hypothetical protein
LLALELVHLLNTIPNHNTRHIMKFSTTILPLAMALSVSAQGTGTTGPYTDAKSGITFQTFMDPTGYTFGIALPETPGADFVGVLVGKGKGWAGVSLGGSMLNKLLIAAWPSGTKIVSTFRETTYVPFSLSI